MNELIILSIIQGITEFIPVSSSAHLILAEKLLGINQANLTLDVSLHIGSFIAIILFFTKNSENVLSNKKTLLKIIISSIPVTLVGILLIKFNLISYLRNYEVIGWSTIIFGILLYLSDLKKEKFKIKNDFTYKSAVIVGLFQILSLIPGTSRSGITLTGSRFLKFNKIDSAKISFLTSIPVLFLASIYNIFKIYNLNNFNFSIYNLLAIFLSFIISYLTIKYFLQYLRNYNLRIFIIYRLFLGIFLLFYVYK